MESNPAKRCRKPKTPYRESIMNVLHHVHLTSSPLIFASPFSNPQSKWHGRKLTLKHSILMTLDLALKQRMARNKLVQCIDCVYIVLPQSFSLADLKIIYPVHDHPTQRPPCRHPPRHPTSAFVTFSMKYNHRTSTFKKRSLRSRILHRHLYA